MQLSSCSRQPPLSRNQAITCITLDCGLAFSTTKEKLAEAFSEYGNVLNADIVLNKAKNRSKGFGYVTFAKEEEARKAQMAMNGKILHGRVLYVDMEPNKKPEKSSFDKATTDG
nr:small RNA-binding protein 11, chloroplastic isoform X1 [Arachis hypogaea]